MFNIFDLKLHHIGIVIKKNKMKKLEKLYNKKFNLDKTQGVRVLFVKLNREYFFTEFIVKEGKSINQKIGFNHLCFNVKNKKQLKKIDKKIIDDKMGYPISDLVKSGSKECNFIKFYFLKGMGLIEFNILS